MFMVLVCVFINFKGGERCESSPYNRTYPDLGTSLQGPWESLHWSALVFKKCLQSSLWPTSPIQVSGEAEVTASFLPIPTVSPPP